MTGINSAVTGQFSDPPVIMTGITSKFISRPSAFHIYIYIYIYDHMTVAIYSDEGLQLAAKSLEVFTLNKMF
jgi:hypothetical protein